MLVSRTLIPHELMVGWVPRYYEAQVAIGEAIQGWVYWTWKVCDLPPPFSIAGMTRIHPGRRRRRLELSTRTSGRLDSPGPDRQNVPEHLLWQLGLKLMLLRHTRSHGHATDIHWFLHTIYILFTHTSKLREWKLYNVGWWWWLRACCRAIHTLHNSSGECLARRDNGSRYR